VSWVGDWWNARKHREALRRLGGPDLDEERRKNAMNGEQKAWVLTAWAIAAVLGWAIWNFANYHVSALDARPNPETVLHCIDQCAASCAAAADDL
jgi:hypothetical protein